MYKWTITSNEINFGQLKCTWFLLYFLPQNQNKSNTIYVIKIILPHELMYQKKLKFSNSAISSSHSEVTLTKLLRVTRLQLLFLSASHDLKQE